MKFEKFLPHPDQGIPLEFTPPSPAPEAHSLKDLLTPKSEINQANDRQICSELEVAQDARFQRMHSFGQMGATTAETALVLASATQHLSLTESRTTIDFGAGSGGPTLALAKLAEINGGTAEAIEANPDLAEHIIEGGILPAENVHATDGINFLRHPDNAGRYDLITAFMLGPDMDGELSRVFLDAAKHSLAENGRIVVTSEIHTLTHLESTCLVQGMRCDRVAGVPLNERVMIPDTLVISAPVLRKFR